MLKPTSSALRKTIPIPPTISRNVRQQTRLVDDLLDVTRIENGKVSLLPGLIDHFTPEGALPSADHMAASVDDFIRRMSP